MELYRIIQGNNENTLFSLTERFVMAVNKDEAIKKYIEVQGIDKPRVFIEFIVERKNIIPSVEPKKEVYEE